MRNGLKWLAVLTAIGMFMVVLAGAVVTNTGSARGCGHDWPLCNGKFIPAYTVESLIEYSHRAVTGLVGIMVVVLTIWVWRAVHRKDARFYAMSSLVFTALQAIMGALAVKWDQSSLVLALHFGISLLSLASTMLLAIVMWRIDRPADPSGWGEKYPASAAISSRFRGFVWLILFYCYVVVYLGAFVRHTDSGGGCLGWPLCNGQVIPSMSGATGIVFTHRVAASLLFILICILAYTGERFYKHIRTVVIASRATFILVIVQIFSGAFVVQTMGSEDLNLFARLAHATIVSGLFSVLCYLAILVWQLGRIRHVK